MHTIEEDGVKLRGKGIIAEHRFVLGRLLGKQVNEIFLSYIFWNTPQSALAATGVLAASSGNILC